MGNGYKLQRHVPDYAQVILFLRASVSSTANGVNASAFPTGLEEMDGWMVCVRCLLAGVGGDNHWRRHIFPGFRPHSPRPPACLSGEGAVSAPPRQGRLPRLRAPGCPRAALLMSGRAGQRKHRDLSPAPAGSGPRSTAVLGGASMATRP